MKKSVIAGIAGLVCAAAFAGKDNVLVSFSTPGIDTYADGSRVEDGECYALIWTKSGTEFVGINADGTLVGDNSKIAIAAPVAKDGKCPPVTFQIDEEYAAANYSGGTWGVYLLDTRKFKTAEDGAILPDVDKVGELGADGKPTRVSGYNEVAALSGSTMVSGSASAGVSVTTTSASPASAAGLKITDIKFIGDNVRLTVSGSLSCLAYEVQSGDKPNALEAPEDGKAQYGTGDDTMYIYTPKKPGAQFFKVNRK